MVASAGLFVRPKFVEWRDSDLALDPSIAVTGAAVSGFRRGISSGSKIIGPIISRLIQSEQEHEKIEQRLIRDWVEWAKLEDHVSREATLADARLRFGLPDGELENRQPTFKIWAVSLKASGKISINDRKYSTVRDGSAVQRSLGVRSRHLVDRI